MRANSSETATISGPPAANSLSSAGSGPGVAGIGSMPLCTTRALPRAPMRSAMRGLGLADAEDAGRKRHQRPLDALVGKTRRVAPAPVVERVAVRRVDQGCSGQRAPRQAGRDAGLGTVSVDQVGTESPIGPAQITHAAGGDKAARVDVARDVGGYEPHPEVGSPAGRATDGDLVAGPAAPGEDADVAERAARPRPEHLQDPGVAPRLHLPGEDADVAERAAGPRPEHLQDPGHRPVLSDGGQSRPQRLDALGQLIGGDRQRRQEADRLGVRGVDDDPRLERRTETSARRSPPPSRGRSSARGHGGRRPPAPSAKPRGSGPRASPTLFSSSGAERISSAASAARAPIGPPAKVEPCSPRVRPSPTTGAVTQAPTGRPPPSAFALVITSGVTGTCWYAQRVPVRPMPVWISSKTSSAPVASQASRAASEDLVVDRVDARLALDRLEHHRGRVGPDGGPQRVGVVAGNRDEARRQGPEQILAGQPRGRGEGGDRAAVEGVVEDDDLRPVDAAGVRMAADELDRALVRLGAGVAEEGAPAERGLDQSLGELHRRLGVEEVRRSAQGRRLLGDGGDDRRVAVAGVVDRQAAEQVDVLPAVGVPERRPPPRGRTRPAIAGRSASRSGIRSRAAVDAALTASPSCRCRRR